MFIGSCIIAIVEGMKNQLDVTCYFISLIMRSTCFGHKYIHFQEPATALMNYHIGRLVLSSLCVEVFAAADIWWCSFCRLKHFNLQNEHHQISAAAKTPTHNELRTRRPMW